MNTLGLNVFIAIVGINAGPGFVAGLQQVGLSLFLWGIIATAVPMVLAVLLGHYVFKFHPAILFGVCAGVRTTTAALGHDPGCREEQGPGARLRDAVRHRQHAAHDLWHGGRADHEQVRLGLSGGHDHGRRHAAAVRNAQPVRNQERPGEGRDEDLQGLTGRLPERRTRESELDRDRATVGVLPARAICHHREPAHDAAACRRRRNAEGGGDRRAARRVARRRMPTCRAPQLLRAGHSLGGEDLRFQRGCLRARAGRLDHRRQLPGAGSHARAQRTDRSRVPGSGRCAASPAGRNVRPLRGRGRHGGDVLPLQVAQGEPAAQPGRHHRDGDADLHAVPGDAASRGLRPEDRQHSGAAGTALAVHGYGSGAAPRPRRSRRSSSSIRATPTRWR